MLRRVLVGLIAATIVVLGVTAALPDQWRDGRFFMAWFGFQLVVLLAGLVFERFRYRALDRTAPGPGWTATAERYLDPATGVPVQVWYNVATGERRYVVPPENG